MTAWSRCSPSLRHPVCDVFHGLDKVPLECEWWRQQDCSRCRVDPVGGAEVQQRTPVLNARDVPYRDASLPEDSRDDHAFIVYGNERPFGNEQHPGDEGEREDH